jgi:hypothetical protein
MNPTRKYATGLPNVLQYKNSYNPSHTIQGHSNFPMNPDLPLSIQQEPEIQYEEFEHNIVVASKDRDQAIYPDPQYYRIDLPQVYKNVKSIELTSVIVPSLAATGNILHQPCLYIQIDEINHLVFSDKNIDKAFAVIPLKAPNSTDGFIIPELGCIYNTPNVFKTPLASLANLTIRITDYNGSLFNFGTDTIPPNSRLQNVLVFKIKTLEKKRDILNHRNVF